MIIHRQNLLQTGINVINFLCILTLLTACQAASTPTVISTIDIQPQPTQSSLPEQPKAEITFEAQTLSDFGDDQNLFIEFLDEVTGLALNAARVQMEKVNPHTFILKMPVTVGSVLKYRYFRDQDQFGYEYTSLGKQVRYRLHYTDGPGVVKDIISAWKTEPLTLKTGRIHGQIAYSDSRAPIVNALVAAGGQHTITSSDGSFIIEGLPAGLHNLVIYSLDGEFLPFQQGAVVAEESTTPALVMVNPGKMVNVTFMVAPPPDAIEGLPIRMVGNLYRLGNMFADLEGGLSVIASRAPLLAIMPDGRYSISMKLPAGLDLRYKYSLGDGFWNTERSSTGELRLRQIIIPNKDIQIDDAIDTWETVDKEAISFTFTAPEDTPTTDYISIQFNPFAWTSPIPMWPAGNNRWFYILYNPLNSFGSASYRFCRNDQCGTADSVETRGYAAKGKDFDSQSGEQNFDETVRAWAWTETQPNQIVVPAVDITPREVNFQAGIKFMAGYHPDWQPLVNSAFQNISDLEANTVVFTPTWHMSHQVPPVIEQIPGQDILWTDQSRMVIQAHQQGLSVVIHPVLRYPEDVQTWWQNATRDDGWWQSWFDRYSTFILYHADLAAQTGASMIIVGDESLQPALPGGSLADGSPSNVPDIAEDRWQKLIADIRRRYTGKIAWFIPLNQKPGSVPEFAADFDQLYFQVAGPLATVDIMKTAELESAVAEIVDTQILPIQEKNGQPVIIGLRFPSAEGALDGCVFSGETCLPVDAFEKPSPEYPEVNIDFVQQAEVYTAFLSVINQRSWISGFYSDGYYPPVLLRDLSISVRGKPAADVLWYWYPRWLGKVTQ